MEKFEIADLNSIIQTAAKGEECPAGDLTDIHLHTCLSQLYADYNEQRKTKEDCARLKASYVAAWKADKELLASYHKYIQDFNAAIRNAEQTGVQLHKAENLHDFAMGAAKILEAVIGEVGLQKKVSELK